MNATSGLWEPITVGQISFEDRLAMAPVTRSRSTPGGCSVSPGNTFNDIAEDGVPGLYGALVGALAPLDLACLHVLHAGDEDLLRSIRRERPGALVLDRGGADVETRARDIEDGDDVVAVEAMLLVSPNLVDRIKAGAPPNGPDRGTFYGGGGRGYTDYPTVPETIAAGDHAA